MRRAFGTILGPGRLSSTNNQPKGQWTKCRPGKLTSESEELNLPHWSETPTSCTDVLRFDASISPRSAEDDNQQTILDAVGVISSPTPTAGGALKLFYLSYRVENQLITRQLMRQMRHTERVVDALAGSKGASTRPGLKYGYTQVYPGKH
jgi:hypothetical protein